MSCDFLPLMHTAIVTSGSVSVSLSLLSGMFTLCSLMTTEARLSLSLSFPSHSHMHACTCAGESGKPTGCLPHFPENSKKQFSAGLALVLARGNVPPLQMVYSMPQPWQTAPPVDRLAALNTRK